MLRLVRGRPIQVTESVIRTLHAELIAKEQLGILHVATPAGLRVDLATMAVIEKEPATVPLYQRPLDSIDRDLNTGIGAMLPQYPGGISLSAEVEMPQLGVEGAVEEECFSAPDPVIIEPVVDEVVPEVVEASVEAAPAIEVVSDEPVVVEEPVVVPAVELIEQPEVLLVPEAVESDALAADEVITQVDHKPLVVKVAEQVPELVKGKKQGKRR